MYKKVTIITLLFVGLMVHGQENIDVMFYNLLMFPEEQPTFNRPEVLKDILDEYQPDIFMVCELQSDEGVDIILNESLNYETDLYKAAPFVANQSGSADLQQLVFYRKDKFVLTGTEIIETNIRDINRFQLRLSTANVETDPVFLELYVTHLKSSQGGENVATRLDMVQEFTATLDNMNPDSFIIFAGDLNLYTSTEPAYVELLNPDNPITLVDPINTPGAWNNNINFQAVHTQSTRTSSGGFGTGAGGGMDDRFDFMLLSENMMDDPTLRYVPDTYKAYGNNKNCFNESVNNAGCVGEFDVALRQDLYIMSDHLPVVMTLETDQEFVTLSGTDFDVVDTGIKIKNTLVTESLFLKSTHTPIEVTIYNTLGQEILNNITIDTEETKINVSNLASGVYYVSSKQAPNSHVKFIKK